MKNILRIDSSIFTSESVSNQLLDEIVEEFQRRQKTLICVRHNLANEAIPHLDAAWINAVNTVEDERTLEQQKMVNFSDQLIDEIVKADTLLLGVPMYNFGVSSALKAWFDHIARAGVTFRYTSEGPEGLLKNKTAIIVTTRGGMHKGKDSDTQIPFVKNFLAFLGITDVKVIYAEGLNMGNGAREVGLSEAREHIKQILAA